VKKKILADATIAARVARLDAVTLFALNTHARDRGYPLLAGTRRILRNAGLIERGGMTEAWRDWCARKIVGRGLRMQIKGRAIDAPAGLFEQSIRDFAGRSKYEEAAGLLLKQADAGLKGAARMLRWTAAAHTITDQHGRATPELLRVLKRVEPRHGRPMSRDAAALFQDLVAMTGGKMRGTIRPPIRTTSYWLAGAQPLANYQSTGSLPRSADVVMIGAGLIGASAEWHLSKQAARGLRVIVLEAGDPAGEATGRNGGNFELITENFFGGYGTYDGFVAERAKFLAAAYPSLSPDAIHAQAKRVAETVIRFAIRNAASMRRTIREAGIECDLSSRGWVRTALNRREERSLRDEVALINRLGARARFLSARQIRAQYGIEADFGGRIVFNNGNYHPFHFVTQELQHALSRGVKLYTRTRVTRIESRKLDRHLVHTPRGVISAARVIVATNAFTSELFPELQDIRPFRSQIANYEHVADALGGVTFTCKDGDLYANFPGRTRYRDARGRRFGMLPVGGGKDTGIRDPHRPVPSIPVFEMTRREVMATFAGTKRQPASRLWAGPMAFVEGRTGMRLPVLGPLGEGARAGIFIAVWCNGYGGTGCHYAGAGAAEWALTGRIPCDMPQDVFGPARLFSRRPLF